MICAKKGLCAACPRSNSFNALSNSDSSATPQILENTMEDFGKAVRSTKRKFGNRAEQQQEDSENKTGKAQRMMPARPARQDRTTRHAAKCPATVQAARSAGNMRGPLIV